MLILQQWSVNQVQPLSVDITVEKSLIQANPDRIFRWEGADHELQVQWLSSSLAIMLPKIEKYASK